MPWCTELPPVLVQFCASPWPRRLRTKSSGMRRLRWESTRLRRFSRGGEKVVDSSDCEGRAVTRFEIGFCMQDFFHLSVQAQSCDWSPQHQRPSFHNGQLKPKYHHFVLSGESVAYRRWYRNLWCGSADLALAVASLRSPTCPLDRYGFEWQ